MEPGDPSGVGPADEDGAPRPPPARPEPPTEPGRPEPPTEPGRPEPPTEPPSELVALARDEEAERTGERYARPGADRLGDDVLAEHAARRTGATAAAFFDLDKTIIARSSTLLMSRTFYRDGLLGTTSVLRGLYAQAVYQLVGADHARMEQMRAAALDLTRGWDAERVRALARDTVEEVISPLVYAEALEIIDGHRRAGRDVWIVSSSGEEIVTPFAEILGITETIATRSGVDDEGRYDGTLEFYAYAGAKATAIRQVAEVRGYDLAACWCYSDSITDLPMLAAVGHPVAANPDRELRAAATAMGWEVREFTSPVSLRARLPHPSPPTLLGVGIGALGAALVAWRVVLRGRE